MKKTKITILVLLCILAVGLCGVLVYGMGGQNLYGTKYVNSASQLVMEKRFRWTELTAFASRMI